MKPADAFLMMLRKLADLENSLDQLMEEQDDWRDNANQLADAFKDLRKQLEREVSCMGRS